MTRLFVSHIHVLGAGVDSEHLRLSMEEGQAFSGKAKIELICEADEVDEFLAVVRDEAATAHRGDGVIAVTNLDRIWTA